MLDKKEKFYMNGINDITDATFEKELEDSCRRLRRNEWIFTLCLLLISTSMVIGKIYVNYWSGLQWQSVFPLYNSTYINTIFGMASMSELPMVDTKQLIDTTNVTNTLISLCTKYGWLIKATTCGLTMVGFTWFIIYKDSNVPGINPSFPSNPFKQRSSNGPIIHMNYFIGVLNGILVFVYMCL